MRLEGKVAIITGGSAGMGAETARLFAQEGATVIISDILEDEGKRIQAAIRAAGGDATFFRADVASENDWRAVVAMVVARCGKLDILVNNAGIGSSASDPTDTDGWRRIMEVNATSVFLGTKYVVPVMQRAGSGSIVNISSIMGFVGDEGSHPAYHASKGAVRILTKQTAVEYGSYGIRANSVHPGFMTPMRTSHPDPVRRNQQAQMAPLRRIGTAIEVAYGILFLASDESSFVTGTELVIDGGFLAR